MEKIFIGVAWPYANGELHVGHLAGAYLAPDIFARFHRLKGNNVLMVSGSDMHGTPVSLAAEKAGMKPTEFAKKAHQNHKQVLADIGVSFNLYTSTATENHRDVVQKEFLTLLDKGFLIKKTTDQLYCVTDKMFLPDRYVVGECPHCHNSEARGDQCDSCGKALDPTELIDPKCKVCDNTPELKQTTHFFLDLPKLEPKLKEWIKTKKDVWREYVWNFTEGLLKEGLKQRAITRDLNYGIPVPIEEFKDKVIYVWFEAVTGYLSAAIEWSNSRHSERSEESWTTFWKNPDCRHYYFIGKDNILFHTLIWPAILMGYDETLNLPYDVPANQYLNLGGQKLSKSKGALVTVRSLLDEYGVDAVRFYFTKNMPEARDGEFYLEEFIKQNNGILVANLGNFINRTLVFIDKFFEGQIPEGTLEEKVKQAIDKAFVDVTDNIDKCHFRNSLEDVLKLSSYGNSLFDEGRPWETVKTDKSKCAQTIYNCIQVVSALSTLMKPFLPQASEKLSKQLNLQTDNKRWEFRPIQKDHQVKNVEPVFRKLEYLTRI